MSPHFLQVAFLWEGDEVVPPWDHLDRTSNRVGISKGSRVWKKSRLRDVLYEFSFQCRTTANCLQ